MVPAIDRDEVWSGYVADSWERFERGEVTAEFERLVRPHLTRALRDVLDVGMGPGQFLAAVNRYYPEARLVGVDADGHHVAVAREDLARRGVTAELLVASGAKIPFPDESFDLVISQMVMPYSHDDRAFLAELARVLRPGGALWFATHGFGFYAVRVTTRDAREKVRYSASIVAGAVSVLSGWKPINDTPVTSGWVTRTLTSIGLEVRATEANGRFAMQPTFLRAAATKPPARRPRPLRAPPRRPRPPT